MIPVQMAVHYSLDNILISFLRCFNIQQIFSMPLMKQSFRKPPSYKPWHVKKTNKTHQRSLPLKLPSLYLYRVGNYFMFLVLYD